MNYFTAILLVASMSACVSQPSGMRVESRVTLPAEMIISGN